MHLTLRTMVAPGFVAALMVLFTSCALAAGLAPGARYVALGSSYAAGPGLGEIKLDAPARCGRSSHNYATLLAERLKLDLIDASCGGATTVNLLQPWHELPPQLDAITPDTQLVTVTIGGNDVDFVKDLVLASCNNQPAAKCPAVATPKEAAWAQLDANMHEIAHQVRLRAPGARLVFVDYITILPNDRLCPAVAMAPKDAAILRGIAERLAAVTATAARDSGAQLLRAGRLSRQHTACDPEPWSVGAPGSAAGTPWHPNAAGMRALADALAKLLQG